MKFLPLNLYTANVNAVNAEKYAVNSVTGTAMINEFANPWNRLKKLDTVSQLSCKLCPGINVKDDIISVPLLVALIIINTNGNKQVTASAVNARYNIILLAFTAITTPPSY